MLVMLAVWSPPKVLGLINNYSVTLNFQTLSAVRVGKHSTNILTMWHPEGGMTMGNV